MPIVANSRSFYVSAPCLIAPYSLFLKKKGRDPALDGLPIAERGRKIASWYRELSATELEALKAEAKTIPAAPRKPRTKKEANKDSTKKRGISAYMMFVKKFGNSDEFKGLSIGDRGKAMAAKYKALSEAERAALKAEGDSYSGKPSTPPQVASVDSPKAVGNGDSGATAL